MSARLGRNEGSIMARGVRREHYDSWTTRSNRKATLRRIWIHDLYSLCGGVGLLRSSLGASHTITLEIARDTQAAQDAVDRELIAHYRPGQPRKGLLVQLVERVGIFKACYSQPARPNIRATQRSSGTRHLSN